MLKKIEKVTFSSTVNDFNMQFDKSKYIKSGLTNYNYTLKLPFFYI